MPTRVAHLGGRYAQIANNIEQPGLIGLVDMHTHLAAHLGFGTELFYGAPDGEPNHTCHNCNPFHGGFGLFDNQQGNEFRRILVDELTSKDGPGGWDHKRNGYPNFPAWPSWHDRLHQQMRVEWLERAWQGGLRVIVTLAVNNHTLADGAETKGPYDDFSAGNAQIEEMRAVVGRHDFMQVVLTPADLRRVVTEGRLAVIIGVELDCIGNFYRPFNTHHSGAGYRPNPSPEDVQSEIQRLYGLGVRYIFPIHITDNVFGGAAVYERGFDAANRYQFGQSYATEPAPRESGITYTHDAGRSFLDVVAQRATLGFDPFQGRPTPPPTTTGHRNARGLTELGKVAVREIMRLGMLLDIDHMSEKMIEGVLPIARELGYPICAGHNGIRGPGGTERQHSEIVARELLAQEGMWGVGLGGGLESFCEMVRRIRSVNPNTLLAIGSDACGLDHLPRPRFNNSSAVNASQRASAGMVVYRDTPGAPSDALLRCRFGNRQWDYSTEGCAHIGLLPDMIEEIVSSRLLSRNRIQSLFRSAEGLAQTWEACSYAAGEIQAEWSWCNKCQGLFYGGYVASSRCPAGGTHAAPTESRSWNYVLTHSSPETAHHQAEWRWCNKCQGLFYGGGIAGSRCPAGGTHAAPTESRSWNYCLKHSVPQTDYHQAEWSWCNKCQGLFYGGHVASSRCPAGGTHAAPTESRSWNYRIRHRV